MAAIVVRWTIGNVSVKGFEALELSIAGAQQVFGSDARYLVCVNTISAAVMAARVRRSLPAVEWYQAANRDIPHWLRPYLDNRMADGVAWKLAPLAVDAQLPTLALDNDVVLWRMPESVARWLEDGDSLLIAEDVTSCYGGFAPWCPNEARNSGIRGTPPG